MPVTVPSSDLRFNGAAMNSPRRVQTAAALTTETDELQWGRDEFTAESRTGRTYAALSDTLQWGRDEFTAESTDTPAEAVMSSVLQWGRDEFTAERRRPS